MSIGTNIFGLRKDAGLTQSILAEKLGVSEQAVSKWENDVCAPDVSLFPSIAKLFNVSIDRVFGFHLDSYDGSVDKIIKSVADADTGDAIAVLSDALLKYPNSNRLKTELSFALLMKYRISDEPAVKNASSDKAVSLCEEVIASSGDTKEIDSALNMLVRIYNETGDLASSEKALNRLSADSFDSRIIGRVGVLYAKNDIGSLLKYVELCLFKCWLTCVISMDTTASALLNAELKTGQRPETDLFLNVFEKLLSVFDEGCPDFYATHKMLLSWRKAMLFMHRRNKEACLSELRRFAELTASVKRVHEEKSMNISDRNSFFRACRSDAEKNELYEECFASGSFETFIKQFDGFFGNDSDYESVRKTI